MNAAQKSQVRSRATAKAPKLQVESLEDRMLPSVMLAAVHPASVSRHSANVERQDGPQDGTDNQQDTDNGQDKDDGNEHDNGTDTDNIQEGPGHVDLDDRPAATGASVHAAKAKAPASTHAARSKASAGTHAARAVAPSSSHARGSHTAAIDTVLAHRFAGRSHKR